MTKATTSDQVARFRAEVARMIDAGELNPAEADAALDRIVVNAKRTDRLDESGKSS